MLRPLRGRKARSYLLPSRPSLGCLRVRVSGLAKPSDWILSMSFWTWQPARLCIREAKFHKTRLVPLHPTAVMHLTAYARQRAEVVQGNTAFFVEDDGQRLRYETLRSSLQRLLLQLGLAERDGCSRPTLHSLRHSFAVTRLTRWHEEGVDVRTRLGSLGHVSGARRCARHLLVFDRDAGITPGSRPALYRSHWRGR